MAGAADEDGIGGRQIREHLRRDAVDRVQVAHAERLGVGQDQMIIGGVLLDGVDRAGFAQPRRLDGHRAGAGADVPDDAGRLDRQLRQGDGAHLRLRDQSALGPALREHVVGIAEVPKSCRRRRTIRPARLALEDDDVERGELHVLNVAQLALRDALVRAAEVLADVHAEIIEAAREQLASDLRRSFLLAGEQADRLGGADAVEDAVQRMRLQIGEIGFFPGFLDPREGELHAADVRQHLEMLLAQSIAQIASDAVKQRIAAGDDRQAFAANQRGQRGDGFLQVGADRTALGLEFRQQSQGLLGAEDDIGGHQQIAGAAGESGQAIAADADDVDARFRSVHDGILWTGKVYLVENGIRRADGSVRVRSCPTFFPLALRQVACYTS